MPALTHKSFRRKGSKNEHYERLEFLGDAALDLVVAVDLYLNSKAPEGEMTKTRSKLVNNRHLGLMSDRLKIGTYIRTNNTFDISRRIKADVLEAIIGVIFLEKGFWNTCNVWKKFQNRAGV